MSWTVLKPISNSTARPLASAAVRVNKDGVVKITVWLSGTLYDEMKSPEQAEIAVGDGDMEGCIRITFGASGGFKFSNFVHGGGRVTIPNIAGVASRQTNSYQCRVVEQTADMLVLRLPTQQWAEEGRSRLPLQAAKPLAIAQIRTEPMPHHGGPAVPFDDDRLDVQAWLKKKGHDVKPLAGGRIQIDGELKTPTQLLHLVNVQRAKDQLPALFIADLRFP